MLKKHPAQWGILLLLFLLLGVPGSRLSAQNCANTSTGMPPVNDLGTGFWNGYQGGLYPGGANELSGAHLDSGVVRALHIRPLDGQGNVDPVNGSVVLISIGMSNTRDEFNQFIPMVDTLSTKAPRLKVVNGAEGGHDLNMVIQPQASYWNLVGNKLSSAGLTKEQVQIVWVMHAESSPNNPTFPGYPQSLKEKYKQLIHILYSQFPNLKLCFFSSRIYAGYASSNLNPEPYAYYSGWAVKWLIEEQIAGDTSLAFYGPGANSPWLAWAAYTWADGLIPRSDGLIWVCPDDFRPDGTHPSVQGAQKVAGMLLDFFTSHPTTVPWFLAGQGVALIQISPQVLNFGAVPVGQTAVQWLWLHNPGTAPLVVDRISTTDSAFSASPDSLHIAPNDSAQVQVSFTAQQTGAQEGYLVFKHNGPTSPDSVRLTADVITSIGELPPQVQHGFRLEQNFPNPFNPSTRIRFYLSTGSSIRLEIFNTVGQRVRLLENATLPAGEHQLLWDGRDHLGRVLPSGVYVYRLKAVPLDRSRPAVLLTRKMVLIQ